MTDLGALRHVELGPSVGVCEGCMGDVGIGGVGGVKGDDSGSIEVLHLLEVRQTDIVYQIALHKSVI